MAAKTNELGRPQVAAVLLPLADAATYLTVGSRTMKMLAASGAVPVVRVSARRIAFRIADLDSYISSRRDSSRS